VLWFQYLTCEVPALDYNYQPIWLVPGTYVLFKEIYVAGISTETLAQRVIQQEEKWRYELETQQWNVKAASAGPRRGRGPPHVLQLRHEVLLALQDTQQAAYD
jgi:hypothetical protein